MSSPSSPSSPPILQSPASRLDSWKQIAAYFDRDVRTVQLWEKKESLPVHRHEHSTRSSVYAFPAELDQWRTARDSTRLTTTPSPLDIPEPAPLPPAVRSVRRNLALASGAILLGALTGLTIRIASQHQRPAPSPLPADPPRLAVLPFQDLSGNHPRELWVDGLTDDLITDLGRSTSLQVISQRSVLPFRGTQEPLSAVAAKLHATLILDGSILHINGEAHVNARLIDPLHGHQLWSAAYVRNTRDILSLQDEIATDIATAVATQLNARTSQPTPPTRAIDPQVRTDYLTGLYLLNQRNEPSLLKAIVSFRAAIATDPNYAPAYAGLADCYNLLAVWGKLPSASAFPQSRAAALQALRLDPTSAEAYTSLAFETFRYEWNFPEADRDFQRAIQLNPNYAPAHHWYGQSLVDRRRFDEGLAELKLAHNLDPLSPILASDLADAYIYANRPADAIAELHSVLSLFPDFVPAHNYLASAYENSGDLTSALHEAEVSQHLTGSDTEIRTLHIAQLLRSGNLTQARTEANSLATGPTMGPVQRADLYFEVGEPDLGYTALDQARAHRDWWIVTLPVDPGFATIRNTPRFQQIEHAANLPTT